MNRTIVLLTLILAASLPAAPALAQESPWRLGIALGYGEKSNPLILSDDIPIVVDLDIAYFGKRFFFDNGDVGLTVADNEWLTGSLMARVNSDRVFFGKTNTDFISIGLDGAPLSTAVEVVVPDRDYAIEAGFEVLSDGSWGYLQLAAFHDVSGTHDGYEVALSYGIGWRSQRWYFDPSIGVSYKSAAMNDYYWGVRPGESSAVLPAYEAGAGINVLGRLTVSYFFSRNWAFTLAAQYERMNDEAAASPIVEDQNVLGWFGGLQFRFQ
jgi:outer membrane protein